MVILTRKPKKQVTKICKESSNVKKKVDRHYFAHFGDINQNSFWKFATFKERDGGLSKLDVKKINTLYNCEGYPQLFESDSTKSESTKSKSTISESTKSESTKFESTEFDSTISEYESIEDPILNGSDLDLIEGDKLLQKQY